MSNALIDVAPQPALTDPYGIFARARQRLEAASYPAQVSYDITVTVAKNGNVSAAHYHLYYDSTNGAVRVTAVSDEELAHPYTPRGINTYLNLFGSGKGIPLSAPQRTFDFLGVPILAPNYFFGVAHYVPHKTDPDYATLVQEIRREFHEQPKSIITTSVSPFSLKTIANVQAISHDYVMHLSGIETVNGHDDYHLVLKPIADPQRYRLRHVWVNDSTFALDRVATQGDFVFGGATGVTWTTDFVAIGGQPYIASEHTGQAFDDYRHKYDCATVEFSHIVPTTIPPYAWYSDFRINGETGMPPLIEPYSAP